jgi:hypothetical protein
MMSPRERPLPTGHDAPVADRMDDCYDRWPVAVAISRVIAASPAPWSTRIGLFGRWGDGKTSVLNFLDMQQRAAGNIVIRYSPWGAADEEEVWRGFGNKLIEGLDAHGIQVGLAARLQHQAKGRRLDLARWLRWGGQAAETAGVLPGAALGSEVASSLIEKHLAVTRQDIERIAAQLGPRRVVVFIDDLDRTDPAVVPKLLLALRELLDFARFAYVLAFDRRIVVNALEEYHRAWGRSGESFLDKVIDFPFELPAPSLEQVRRLAADQFSKLCPFVPAQALARVMRMLPPNPRKLKLLARMLASTRDEALRHEDGELDWEVILLFALVRAESEGLAKRLLSMTVDTGEMDWTRWPHDDAGDAERLRREELDLLLAPHPELAEVRERIEVLVNAWRERLPFVPGERLRYHAMFALTPHAITWGEFKAFLQLWRRSQDVATAAAFIAARMAASQQTRAALDDEFSQTVLSHYGALLERAASAEAGDAHLALMREAADTLDLLSQTVIEQPGLCTLDAGTLLARWERLLALAQQWRHCTANALEPQLRQKEADTLIAWAQRIADPLAVYDLLRPDRCDDSFFGEREAVLRREFGALLRSRVEADAVAAAWGYLARPGEMKRLRSRTEHQAGRYLYTAPDSPLFAPPYKAQLVQLVQDRWGTREATEDAVDWLDLLLVATVQGDDPHCTPERRIAFIVEHRDLLVALWNLCISAPSQVRMLAALRGRRERLVAAGIEALALDEPDWLRKAVRAA